MATWVALLRGINVGGRHVLPMKALATLLEGDGLRHVRTYIQSGNVVFESSRTTAPTLALRIAALVRDRHGFQPHVLVLGAEALSNAAARNPFPEAATQPHSVHLFFLSRAPRTPDLESLRRLRRGREAFELNRAVFYIHTPDGFGVSKLAARVEHFLGVEATARNWRTVRRLLEMADLRRDRPGTTATDRD